MSNWLREERVNLTGMIWIFIEIIFLKNYIPQGDLDTLVFLNVEAIKLKFWIDS